MSMLRNWKTMTAAAAVLGIGLAAGPLIADNHDGGSAEKTCPVSKDGKYAKTGGCESKQEKAAVAVSTSTSAESGASARDKDGCPVWVGRDLRAVISQSPKFSTLWTAIQAAGMQDALKGDGRYTVFAPTNQAFAALPPGALENLLKPENRDQLRSVIKHHIVAGSNTCNEACGMRNFPALGGGTLAMGTSDGKTTVNGAVIALSDVPATNGMVHVIDQVLMPKQ